MKTILKDYFDNQRNGINGAKLTLLMVLFFFFMFFQIIFLEEVQFLNNIDEFVNVFFSFPTFPIFGAFNSFLFVVILLWFFGYSFPRCEIINKNNKTSSQLIISISLILLFFTFLLYDYNREGNLKFGNVVLYFLAAASEEIINRVAQSKLVVIDLEDFYNLAYTDLYKYFQHLDIQLPLDYLFHLTSKIHQFFDDHVWSLSYQFFLP